MINFSRSEFPNGGWQFLQAATGWEAPNPKGNTFDQQVVNIIKHRLANPAMIVKHKLATDAFNVGNELENYTRARLGMGAMGADLPKSTAPASIPQMSGPVQAAVAAVKKLAAGAALLLEWEESGMTAVAPEESERRAGICSTCPKNEQGKTLSEIFTIPASEAIRRRYERLEGLSLKTSHDDKLKVCSACLCPLRLKVHAPLSLILKRLKAEQRNDLDSRCWILSEEKG